MRIYSHQCLTAKNDETKHLLRKTYEIEVSAKERMPEVMFNEWVVQFHAYVRELFRLPNQVFILFYDKKEDEVKVFFFDVEVGGHLKAKYDKDKKVFYIEIDNETGGE